MKFPFFKAKKVLSTNAENNETRQLEISAKLQAQLPSYKDTVKIKYRLLCKVGRKGGNFAAKLAETGDDVFYSAKGTHQYYVMGTTAKMSAKEELIKEKLLSLIENGEKYDCTLNEWSIEADC